MPTNSSHGMIKKKTTIRKTIQQWFSARTRVLKTRVLAMIAPISQDEDLRRQELILNIILIFSIVFLFLLDITALLNNNIIWTLFTLTIIWCVFMLIASKHGYGRTVSYTIIYLYGAGAFYGGWHWGASLPIILLSFALLSITASILIGSSFGFIVSGLIIISLTALSIHEIYSLGVLPWKYQTITVTDIVTYSAIVLFIAGLSWLSNREIEISLKRARASEEALAHERDLLEIKVEERTEELRRTQAKRIAEISHCAEFGRLSQGLFHDLMTPLSSVSLHMEQLRNINVPEVQETRSYLQKAIRASRKMGEFMNLIKNHIKQNSENNQTCYELSVGAKISILDELRATIEILTYRARALDVLIHVKSTDDILLQTNPFYFQRIFLNLITNALDAHETDKNRNYRHEKKINIEILSHRKNGFIIVSDNGPGICSKKITKIFDPFFTTKSLDKGIGVGLSTVKNIVEENLRGIIRVKSTQNKQTNFIISFPL